MRAESGRIALGSPETIRLDDRPAHEDGPSPHLVQVLSRNALSKNIRCFSCGRSELDLLIYPLQVEGPLRRHTTDARGKIQRRGSLWGDEAPAATRFAECRHR